VGIHSQVYRQGLPSLSSCAVLRTSAPVEQGCSSDRRSLTASAFLPQAHGAVLARGIQVPSRTSLSVSAEASLRAAWDGVEVC
jgi:hypothetical protein